jgi:hypothetical protein
MNLQKMKGEGERGAWNEFVWYRKGKGGGALVTDVINLRFS